MIHLATKRPGQCIRIDGSRMVVIISTNCSSARLAVVSNEEGERLMKEISTPNSANACPILPGFGGSVDMVKKYIGLNYES